VVTVIVLTTFEIFYFVGNNKANITIDYILLGVGSIRIVFLDLPIVYLFIYELREVKKLLISYNLAVKNQTSYIKKNGFLIKVLQLMPILMIIIFIERSLINNLVLRIQTLLRNQAQTIDWLD
jgi:hypothetical protein